jgi:hypothetical protein
MGNVYEALRRAEARRSEREASDADEVLADPGEIHWEGAIFERVTSIEGQLAALEEGLGKRVREVEAKLLHLLEGRLAALEAEVHRSMSELAGEIARESDRNRSVERRVLWALAALGLAVLLF